ncbi:hypothetical protein ACGFWE_41710 [Streptomyces sp. NPDC048523]|uniref:hypothetical protein n=1 Tax=Streptomyces sp. NPDC048523 TaxID=3365567 RepID=UPI003717A1C6
MPAGTQSRQLFVDGVRAQRARGPLNPSGFTLSGPSFTTSDSSYASFTNASSVEVVDNNAWKQMRCPLASITAPSNGGSSLNVDPTCFANNNTSVPNRQFPFNGAGLPKLSAISFVENAYQLLDSPGEFYLDSSAGRLYYKPRSGENLSTADVELPTTETLLNVKGTPGHLTPVNDTDPAITYTGSWSRSSGRSLGDLYDDVHTTQANGDSVSYTFTGTGIDVLSETNSDEGGIDVYVDGTKVQSVSAAASSRLAQQVVASVSGLAKGRHTIKLVKTGGTYMVLDGFTVVPDAITPAHDITFQGLTFAYTTWTLPSTAGYIDNQAGVLWDTADSNAPIRIRRGHDRGLSRRGLPGHCRRVLREPPGPTDRVLRQRPAARTAHPHPDQDGRQLAGRRPVRRTVTLRRRAHLSRPCRVHRRGRLSCARVALRAGRPYRGSAPSRPTRTPSTSSAKATTCALSSRRHPGLASEHPEPERAGRGLALVRVRQEVQRTWAGRAVDDGVGADRDRVAAGRGGGSHQLAVHADPDGGEHGSPDVRVARLPLQRRPRLVAHRLAPVWLPEFADAALRGRLDRVEQQRHRRVDDGRPEPPRGGVGRLTRAPAPKPVTHRIPSV